MADSSFTPPPNDPLFYPSPEALERHAEAKRAMTRAYRTRGRMIPLIGALTGLLFAVLVPCWYRTWVGYATPITILILGAIPMVMAIPCHVLGGNQGFLKPHPEICAALYLLGITLNTIGTSLCMTAYYLHLQVQPPFSTLIAAALIPIVLYGILTILFHLFPNRYGLLTGITGLILVALMITGIVFWVRSDSKVFFSFGFFTLLWSLITVIALHVACSDEESPWLRFASFASFGILMAVGGIVLIILVCAAGDGCDCDCGGDCCDCGDCGCGGEGSGQSHAAKKKKMK